MSYPTTAELVAASSVSELTSLDATQQDSLRVASIAAVEEFCGQSFEAEVKTLTLDGQGSNALYLPERLAVLNDLALRGYSLGADSFVLSSRRDRISLSLTGGLGYYEQAMAEVSREKFPVGIGTVSITGTWGWLDAEFPAVVAVALRYDMEDTARADANGLAPTIYAFRKLGLRTISQGNLNADMQGSTGLTPRVTDILAPYVWQGNLGALV